MRWDVDPVLLDVGFLEIRWYGLFFALGVFLGIGAIQRSFRRRGLPEGHLTPVCLWLIVGMIVGAHWGHLLFYEPRTILENPLSLLDLRQGLASHGGGLGAILALWGFARRRKVVFRDYLDACIVGAVWVLPLVRIGNFFNSEIYGRPTDLPWGVVFVRNGFVQPRHPTQLYEALLGFAIVGMAAWIDRKRLLSRPGDATWLVLLCYFLLRFAVEFWKEYQTLSPSFPLTMGQLLSLPFVLVFAVALLRGRHS